MFVSRAALPHRSPLSSRTRIGPYLADDKARHRGYRCIFSTSHSESRIMPTLIAPQRTTIDESSLPPGRVPRTSLVDRITLRVALWLLMRSTRVQTPSYRTESQRTLHEQERESRESEWQLRYLRLPLN